MPEPTQIISHPSDSEHLGKHVRTKLSQDSMYEKQAEKVKFLTTRETIELFHDEVESARDEYLKSVNGEPQIGVQQPKLTLDLRGRTLNQVPKEAIATIKHEVERLHLARNKISQIPLEFAQCSTLRYLNLRDNSFKEIPKPVDHSRENNAFKPDSMQILQLPQLEILDLSRNEIYEIPVEVERLRALRVLSVQRNHIEDLPRCLGNINTLRLLKVMENPVTQNPTFRYIFGDSNTLTSPASLTPDFENERDTILTKKLMEHMRSYAAARDSGEDSTSDEPVETPRALSRFPVQPQYSHSTSGSESASDLRSPVFSRPTLPSRSHTRVPSSQYGTLQSAAPRRPGLAPLTLGNERNRSNSESILQSTQNTKVKRMGLVTKKNSDLGVLDESRANRNSHHLRGQSHGSALRNSVRAGDSSPSDDLRGEDVGRGLVLRSLAKSPEGKRDSSSTDEMVEISRGALFSLDMLYFMAPTLTGVFKKGKPNKSPFDRDFLSMAMHIERLDQGLLRLDSVMDHQVEVREQSKHGVLEATHECLISFCRLIAILTQTANIFAHDADPKYFRKMMLTTYGSGNEAWSATNAYIAHPPNTVARPSEIPRNPTVSRVSTISEASNEGDYTYVSDRSITPTQRRKPAKRWPNDTIIQHSINHPNLPTPGAQTAIPLLPNGRSRSNSRVTPFHSSTSSSVVSTPRSGESFNSASFAARSRSGSVNSVQDQVRADRQEAAHFDQIFKTLKRSIDEGLAIIPYLRSDFLQALEAAEKQYANPMLRNQWAFLVETTTNCLNMTEELRTSLSNVRLNDREARNVRAFWQLAKAFLDSYGNLLLTIKEAMRHDLIEKSLRQQLRSVHATTRDAARLIATSPWNRLTLDADPQATPQPTTAQLSTQQQLGSNGYQQHRTRGSGGSAGGRGSSPYPSNVPATPLSAALGPAAQATIPATTSTINSGSQPPPTATLPPTPASVVPPTPSTASLERSFEGDIFQRADTYASLQQTMIPRRQMH